VAAYASLARTSDRSVGGLAMVIGQDFAWSHMPKTAGDATLALFRLLPSKHILFFDSDDSNDKHAPFGDRHEDVQGKALALNIRRLPSWILSYTQHQATRGEYPDYRPVPMSSPMEMAKSRVPDNLLAMYTGNWHYHIDYWLRMEHLQEDFLQFMRQFAPLSDKSVERIQAHPKVNMQHYDHEIADWFSRAQIIMMYENNPRWAQIEKAVFGALIEE